MEKLKKAISDFDELEISIDGIVYDKNYQAVHFFGCTLECTCYANLRFLYEISF